MATNSFAAVKKILDDGFAAWQAKQGREADLSVHRQGFGWETRDQLAQARAFDLPLLSGGRSDMKVYSPSVNDNERCDSR
jgi:hypothetical protein